MTISAPAHPSQQLGSPPANVRIYGQGAPVVLLHGWGASSELFEPIAERLKDKFKLIVPDFPGFGATPPPPAAWSVHDYTRWLRDVLAGLEIDNAYIVGHSFGGRVSIVLASQSPELVRKIVLTDSAGIVPKRTWRYHVQVRSYKALRWVAQQRWLPGPLRTWGQRAVERRGSSDYQQAAGTVRASLVRVVNEDLRHLLPSIAAPTLLVWGDHDEDTPLSDAKLMEQLLPDAGLVVFEGAGHYAYLEQAARFCTIIATFFDTP